MYIYNIYIICIYIYYTYILYIYNIYMHMYMCVYIYICINKYSNYKFCKKIQRVISTGRKRAEKEILEPKQRSNETFLLSR